MALNHFFIKLYVAVGLLASVAYSQQITTVVSSGLSGPQGVAVDTAGNIYIADFGSNSLKKWTAATQQISTLASGFNEPSGLAIDAAGNIYIADRANSVVKKWAASTSQVSILISGLNSPSGVAIDSAGNVYVGDQGNGSGGYVEEWNAATQQVSTVLSSSQLGYDVTPNRIALDTAGIFM